MRNNAVARTAESHSVAPVSGWTAFHNPPTDDVPHCQPAGDNPQHRRTTASGPPSCNTPLHQRTALKQHSTGLHILRQRQPPPTTSCPPYAALDSAQQGRNAPRIPRRRRALPPPKRNKASLSKCVWAVRKCPHPNRTRGVWRGLPTRSRCPLLGGSHPRSPSEVEGKEEVVGSRLLLKENPPPPRVRVGQRPKRRLCI